ncbi:MAG: hypothetical protein R3F14_21125 [Polyangiaceae bacterium]
MRKSNRSSLAALVIVPAIGLSLALSGCSLFKRTDESEPAPAGRPPACTP